MTPEPHNIEKWCEALRSGEYKQTVRSLQNENGFCCLGVACDVFIPTGKILRNDRGFIFGAVPATQPHSPEWLKRIRINFYKDVGCELSLLTMNDSGEYTFDEIADVLEAVYIHKVLEGCE